MVEEARCRICTDPAVLEPDSEAQAQLATMFIRQRQPQLAFPTVVRACDGECEAQ